MPETVPSAAWPRCRQCGQPMNPIEAAMGPVCGECCKRNHERMTGAARRRQRRRMEGRR